jgi:hypothetical protein
MVEYKKRIGVSREQEKTYLALVQRATEEVTFLKSVSLLLVGHDGGGW